MQNTMTERVEISNSKFPPVPRDVPIHPYVQYLASSLTKIGRYGDLEAAIQQCHTDGIVEFEDWDITDANRFLQYASFLLNSWIPSENQDGTFIYYVLTVFYYVFDRPQLMDLQTPIKPNSILGDMPMITPISNWITGYAVRMGRWLDTSDSITPESYQSFWGDPKSPEKDPYKMQDYLIPDPKSPTGGFLTFNQLFCRFLREPYPYSTVRPIAGREDHTIVNFPADSTFDGAWQIGPTNIVDIYDTDNNANDVVDSKGLLWPISALLAGSKYSGRFAGGTWAHAFLNTFDYHRQHAPVAGTVVEASNIEGLCYLEVIPGAPDKDGKRSLSPHRSFRKPKQGRGDVVAAQPDAPDHAGYEFIQTRGLIIIDTKGKADVGLVAVLPMGMAQVSSVKLAVKVGDKLEKGQEISHFEFGGSDIVLVFEKGAGVGGWAKLNDHHLMGEKMAVLARAT